MKSLHETKKRKRDNAIDEMEEKGSSSRLNEDSKAGSTVEKTEDKTETMKSRDRQITVMKPIVKPEKDEDDDILMDEEAIARAMKRAKKEEGLKSKGTEFMQLREELLRSRRAVSVLTGAEAAEVRNFMVFRVFF